MYTPVLIIGSGIAGLSVAHNLKKSNIKSTIITKAESYLKSNSIIAPANMRVFENYEEGIKLYMNQCNGNEEMIKSIYYNQKYLIETLENLGIKTKKTPIGIIPESNGTKGGHQIMKALGENIENIMTSTVLLDIKINSAHVECLVYNKEKGFLKINCSVLVFSVGGFANIFKYNDNSNTATGDSLYILQKETSKLKGISTIMFHPFSINEGKKILVGDIVSSLENIYEKDKNGNFKTLNMNNDTLEAIKNNAYHNNEKFSSILRAFKDKDVYLKFADEDSIKEKLKKYGYSLSILKDNMINVMPTAHYTSGGFEVDANFKVDDKIFANGECVFDGNKGIGRIPGHPFTSAIVSGKIISEQIKNIQMNETYETTDFKIEEKIKTNDENNLENNKKILEYFSEKVSDTYLKEMSCNEIEKIINQLNESIEKIEKTMKCVKEVQIYYSLKLIKEVLNEKIKEV